MKTIVMYNSKTGFTKKYGEWIAAELGCEAKPVKEVKNVKDYDCIIYGGWIMGGHISGLDKIKTNPDIMSKKLVVYATGATSEKAVDVIEGMRESNFTKEEQDKIPFYYMESGINFENMGFFPKTLLKTMGKSLAKKKDKTEMDAIMAKMFEESSDSTDKKYIEPLVEYVKGL